MTVGRVIYTQGGGRLGNQVLRFAHWLAWAHEHAGAAEVRNLAFWPHAGDFEVWRAHPGCVFPLRADGWDDAARALRLLPGWIRHRLDWRLRRQVQALGHRRAGWQAIELDVPGGEQLDLGDPAVAARFAGCATTTCAGWRIGSWTLLARHEAAVRRLLQPARDHRAAAADFIGALRRRHGFLIGVHQRQGDYRAWHDGRFLFPAADYARWIGQALALHRDRDPAVVLVSDGPAAAATGPVHRPPGGTAIGDWTALTQCDVILCAPSTFPATAAFVGGCPLWPVTQAGQELSLAQVLPDGLLGAARHPEFSLAVR